MKVQTFMCRSIYVEFIAIEIVNTYLKAFYYYYIYRDEINVKWVSSLHFILHNIFFSAFIHMQSSFVRVMECVCMRVFDE